MVRLKFNQDHLESSRLREDNRILVSIDRRGRNGMDGCACLHTGAFIAMFLHGAGIFGRHAACFLAFARMQRQQRCAKGSHPENQDNCVANLHNILTISSLLYNPGHGKSSRCAFKMMQTIGAKRYETQLVLPGVPLVHPAVPTMAPSLWTAKITSHQLLREPNDPGTLHIDFWPRPHPWFPSRWSCHWGR